MKKKNLQHKVVIICTLLGVFFLGCGDQDELTEFVEIGSVRVMVDVAQSSQERSRGLSGRREICESCGMLFVFDSPDQYEFWMKDMVFDIDIIWINDHTVVDHTSYLDHSRGEMLRVRPSVPVDRVLEVSAGFVDENDVKIGQKVRYSQRLFE